MLDRADVHELIALVERSMVCSEATELLEHCLAEHSLLRLEAFIEHKVLADHSSLDTLQDLAETIHRQMVSLQESLFELRSSTLKSLSERFRVDLAQLLPADLIEEYYRLELDEALAFVAQRYPHLTQTDLVDICHTLHNSANRAGEITRSIHLVRQMLDYLFDWTEALSIRAVQSSWSTLEAHSPHTLMH